MTPSKATGRRGAVSWRTATLALSAGLLAPLAVIDPLGLAPFFAIAAVTLLVFARDGLGRMAWQLAPAALLFLLLTLWATVSASWSILPLHSLLEGLRLGVIGAGGLVLIPAA